MSDTQGVEDAGSDNATGGPVNDMPNMPNAAPSPRFVPQGLSGMARAFFGGRPAPQPAQPSASSWMTPPGASQPNQQNIHPDAPRWQGTTASLFLPKGADQPPAKFTPFMPTRSMGDWQSWGKPDQFGMQPQSFELPSIYQGLGKFFGGQSGLSGPLGLLILTHAGDYMKGVMMGEEFRSKQALQNLQLRALQLQEQQEAWHTDTADIFRKYFETAGEDKAKAGTTLINGVNMMDAVHAKALQNGDKDVADMIENGATSDAVMRYVDYRDGRLKDLQKANAKMTEQQAEDKGWNEESGQGGDNKPSGEPAGSPFAPSAAQAQPSPTPNNGAPAPSPAQPGDPFANTASAANPGQTGQEQQGGVALGPDERAGLDFAMGGPADALPKGEHGGKAKAYANKIQGQLDDLAGRSQGMSPQDAMTALRAINPTIASKAQGLLNGAPVPGGWSQVGSRPFWNSLVSILQNSNPGYLPEDANELTTFLRSYDSGVPATTLMRTSRLGDAALTVARAVKEAETTSPMSDVEIVNRFNRWIDTHVDDNPAWNKVFNAYFGFVQENVAVLSGGRPYVTDSKELLQQNPITGGPRIIRGILAQDSDQSFRVAQGLNEDYRRRTHKQTDAPHYNPHQMSLLGAVAKMKDDGTFPSDTDLPPEVKALGSGAATSPASGWKPPAGWTITPVQ